MRVAGAADLDEATTLHGLQLPPSFCLGKDLSDSIQGPQCNWSI